MEAFQDNLCLIFDLEGFFINKTFHARELGYFSYRAELCDTSGILTGAMALNLKDRDDKGHDTIKKNGEIGKYPPALYSFTT